MGKAELVYPELSYKIVGLLFEVYNELGPGHKEKVYEKALAVLFEENNIRYEEQLFCPVVLKGKQIGKYFIDFLVEKKIVLELKQGIRTSKKNLDQVHTYLKTNNFKLGIIAQFGTDEVKFKRVLNIKR